MFNVSICLLVPVTNRNVFFFFLAPPAECLWHKNIMSVNGFQIAFKEIEKLLDPDRPLGGDYKTLAGVYGKSQSDILYLGSQQYPTKVLLQQQNPTLNELRMHLLGDEMNRPEVVDVMKKWIETNCDCGNCSLR